MKACPNCAESIQDEATVCIHCNRPIQSCRYCDCEIPDVAIECPHCKLSLKWSGTVRRLMLPMVGTAFVLFFVLVVSDIGLRSTPKGQEARQLSSESTDLIVRSSQALRAGQSNEAARLKVLAEFRSDDYKRLDSELDAFLVGVGALLLGIILPLVGFCLYRWDIRRLRRRLMQS